MTKQHKHWTTGVKPNEGEWYWSYEDGFAIIGRQWWDSVDDYLRLNAGIAFKTSQEAKDNQAIKYKEITGEDMVWYTSEANYTIRHTVYGDTYMFNV